MTDENDKITIEDFAKVEMRVGKVLSAEIHPNADRLLVVKVDIGDEERQLVAGMRKWYTPEELVGKKVIVAANLKPARMRGVESQGMMLAATGEEEVVLLGLDKDVEPGAKVS